MLFAISRKRRDRAKELASTLSETQTTNDTATRASSTSRVARDSGPASVVQKPMPRGGVLVPTVSATPSTIGASKRAALTSRVAGDSERMRCTTSGPASIVQKKMPRGGVLVPTVSATSSTIGASTRSAVTARVAGASQPVRCTPDVPASLVETLTPGQGSTVPVSRAATVLTSAVGRAGSVAGTRASAISNGGTSEASKPGRLRQAFPRH